MSDHLETVENEIFQVMKQMIVDMKLEKQISDENIDQYLSKLKLYRSLTKEDMVMKKSVVSLMFFLFSTLVFYAQYAKYDPEIMQKIFRLRIGFLELFDTEGLYGESANTTHSLDN